MVGHYRRRILSPVNRSSVVSEAERHLRPQAGRELHPPLAAAHETDVALVRRWFRHLELCVRSADYEGARPLFAQDVITFGTFAVFTSVRDATETEQWRTVWSRIDGFRWQLDDLRTILSADVAQQSEWPCSLRSATRKTAYLMTGPDAPPLCWHAMLSPRLGPRSICMCLCFETFRRARSAPRQRTPHQRSKDWLFRLVWQGRWAQPPIN